MAIFGKKETPTLEDILKLVEALSEEEKEKVKKVLSPTPETENAESEVVATDEEAEKVKEENPQQEPESVPEKPDEEAESESEMETAETENGEVAEVLEEHTNNDEEIEKAETAELKALRADMDELKTAFAEFVKAFEDRPFGAKGSTPPQDENNGKWEGPATKSYFRK